MRLTERERAGMISSGRNRRGGAAQQPTLLPSSSNSRGSSPSHESGESDYYDPKYNNRGGRRRNKKAFRGYYYYWRTQQKPILLLTGILFLLASFLAVKDMMDTTTTTSTTSSQWKPRKWASRLKRLVGGDSNSVDIPPDEDKKVMDALAKLTSPVARYRLLVKRFQLSVKQYGGASSELLKMWLTELDQAIRDNIDVGTQWIRPNLLPPLEGEEPRPHKKSPSHQKEYFMAYRRKQGAEMAWEKEWKDMQQNGARLKPAVDYTDPSKYVYPELLLEPDTEHYSYPELRPMGDLFTAWPQDDDFEPQIHETLLHFNFLDPVQLATAEKFRDAELPFKLTNVPEVVAAGEKWTDEYVADNMANGLYSSLSFKRSGGQPMSGHAQESVNNFFCFHTPKKWDLTQFGMPPMRDNDMSYSQWAEHAVYADAVSLPASKPHFYFQSGVCNQLSCPLRCVRFSCSHQYPPFLFFLQVDPEERYKDSKHWTFVTRDLPSFGGTEANFFLFHPEAQKGIQCRFGERGVVAATHYDNGRNST